MKKFILKLIIIIQLCSMCADLLSELLFTDFDKVELAEKKAEKKDGSCEDDCKDKILSSHFTLSFLSFSKSHYYLHFSTTLPNIYLQQVELPPNLA
jgi:hypothetical protein